MITLFLDKQKRCDAVPGPQRVKSVISYIEEKTDTKMGTGRCLERHLTYTQRDTEYSRKMHHQLSLGR